MDTVVDDPGNRSEATMKPSKKPSKVRAVAIGFVGVVAVLSLVLGVLGFWTIRTAADSERFEARVEDLVRREDISDALARRIVAEVTTAVDLGAALDEVLPEPLKPAVNVLLAGVRSRVELQLGERLREERFVGLVGAASGRAHANVVKVIQGDDVIDGASIVGGEVRVNLLPVVATALRILQGIGLFAGVDIPDLERGGDPDEQRAALAEAIGRPLPAGFGEIVVFTNESLDQAGTTVELVRDVLVLARRAFWLLLAVGLGLGALAIRLSVQRWRSAAFLVAGLFASALAVRLVVGRVRDRLPDVVEQQGARAAVAEIAGGLERSLNNTLITVATMALIALVGVAFVIVRYPRPAE